ncbi:MAG: hypothetical protein ACXVJ7_06760 [Acidimicrobiia bacterium]
MTALVVLLGVVVALLVVLVVSLLRSHAEILRTLHDAGLGHEPGAAAPAARRGAAPSTPSAGPSPEASDISGVTPDGDAVAVGIVGSETPTLLAFLSSGCLTCREFWETFGARRRDVPGGARLVVVTMSPEDESVGAVRRLVTEHTLVVMSTPAWEAYEVEGSPYFVYVDGETGAVVGEGTATSWDRVREMVADSMDDGALAASRRRAAARQRRAARRHLTDRARESRADDALAAAGIEPGDARLYPATGGPGSDPGPAGPSAARPEPR